MAINKIPTSTDATQPWYKQNTKLGAREYILEFQWNQRNGRWYLSMYDQDESPIFHGKPLALGCDLLFGLTDERLPAGQLFVRDTSGQGLEAGLTDLGDRVVLYFMDA